MIKSSIVMLVALLTGMLAYVAYYGRQARLTYQNPIMIALHRGGTNWVMALAVLAIVLIEVLVYQLPSKKTPLLWAHLPFAITFAGLFLLMRFRFDGLRSGAHRTLAYLCLAAYAGALCTGMLLFYRM